jgi:hypothetical protein
MEIRRACKRFVRNLMAGGIGLEGVDFRLSVNQGIEKREFASAAVMDMDARLLRGMVYDVPEISVALQQATARLGSRPSLRSIFLPHVPRVIIGRLALAADFGKTGLVETVQGRRPSFETVSEFLIPGRDALSDFHVHGTFPQHEIRFGQHMPYTMQEDRQQIEVQLFGKVERTAVKPLDAAIRRTGSFGKDDDGRSAATFL